MILPYVQSIIVMVNILFFFNMIFLGNGYNVPSFSCLVQCVPCPVPQTDDREAKRDTPEEGELQDKKMEITIRNSPYIREDSTEDR